MAKRRNPEVKSRCLWCEKEFFSRDTRVVTCSPEHRHLRNKALAAARGARCWARKYHGDPEYRAKILAYHRGRRETDPEYIEQRRAYSRHYYRKLRVALRLLRQEQIARQEQVPN